MFQTTFLKHDTLFHRHIGGPDPGVPPRHRCNGTPGHMRRRGQRQSQGTPYRSYQLLYTAQQLSALRPSPPWRALFVNIGGFQMQIKSQLTPPANWQACCCAACWHNRVCVCGSLRRLSPGTDVTSTRLLQGYSTEIKLLDANDSYSVLEDDRYTNKSELLNCPSVGSLDLPCR